MEAGGGGGGGEGARFGSRGGEGARGPNSQQPHDVVLTSMRRKYFISTSCATRFLIHQSQIITFIILKSDFIENSIIELKGIVLQVPSNQIKVTFIIVLPFQLGSFVIFPVSHRN